MKLRGRRWRERDSLYHVQCVSDLQVSTHICAPTIVILATSRENGLKERRCSGGMIPQPTCCQAHDQ